jgi:hypothetical protein
MSFSDVSLITCINISTWSNHHPSIPWPSHDYTHLERSLQYQKTRHGKNSKYDSLTKIEYNTFQASTSTSCFHTTRPSLTINNIAHPDEYTPFKAGGQAKWPRSSFRFRLQWTTSPSRQTTTTIRIPFFLLAITSASSSIT